MIEGEGVPGRGFTRAFDAWPLAPVAVGSIALDHRCPLLAGLATHPLHIALTISAGHNAPYMIP